MTASTFPLDALPPALAHALLPGGERRDDLFAAHALAARLVARDAAAKGMAAAGLAGLAALSRELLLAAFESEPLDGPLAAAAVREAPAWPLRRAALAVAGDWRLPEDDRYLARLMDRNEPAKLFAYARDKAVRDPGNMFWRSLAVQAASVMGDYEALDPLFPERSGPLAALSQRFQGDVAMLAGYASVAVRSYALSNVLAASPWTLTRLAAARLALGERDEAVAALWSAHAARPWHAGTLLRLYDLVFGRDRRREKLRGGAVALFYSYNKARDLDAALESLAQSDFYGGAVEGPATALVLDNGSTDETASVIAAWAERLGSERLVPVVLPVNVGAPAARNWLMRRPECRERAFTAFLDDDAMLDPEWTGLLAAAAADYPEAGVWGCKVSDFTDPSRIQTMDMFLGEPAENAASPDNPFGRKFEPTRTNPRAPDLGQYAYMRPCASVTGCCHLFRTQTLLACGEFDIRFSPSQYDDLDHDLRLLLSGRAAVYQGHLRIGHRKRSGGASLAAGPREGVAFANLFKLHGKHSVEDAARAVAVSRTAALDDLRRKWTKLRELGPDLAEKGAAGAGA